MGKKSVSHVNIVGGDESHQADVTEVKSAKALSVKVENQLVVGSGLKTSQVTSNQSITSNSSFDDLLNVSGEGVFYGSKIKFSNESVEFRIEVDGIESFVVDFDFLDDLNFEDFSNTGLQRWFGKGNYGELEFFPSQPISYETSLKVQVRKKVTWNINVERALIIYA